MLEIERTDEEIIQDWVDERVRVRKTAILNTNSGSVIDVDGVSVELQVENLDLVAKSLGKEVQKGFFIGNRLQEYFIEYKGIHIFELR